MNLALVHEILKNNGKEAALTYLVNHEEMTHDEALNFLEHNTQNKEPSTFEHYCMRDKQLWIGDKDSLCPICFTNGVVEDYVPDNTPKGFWERTATKMILFKRKVLG